MKNILLTIGLLSSISANAATFDEADSYFNKRETNVSNTKKAVELYVEIADNTQNTEELLRAMRGALHSQIYLARDLLTDRNQIRQAYQKCHSDLVEKINPQTLGYESPYYHYYKAACLVYYRAYSGTNENLQLMFPLEKAYKAGLRIRGGRDYEGGGFYRVTARYKIDKDLIPLPGGDYNPEFAQDQIDKALAVRSGLHIEGSLICENYLQKMEILEVLDKKTEAIDLGYVALDDFQFLLDFEEIPARYIPETKKCLERTITRLENLSS